ncbi:MAG: 2-hydroxychromene-2-carboxylate isomerase, partial [Salaquimonas sp.]
MTKKIEFYFDIVSPASYLAWTQMPKLEEETGATVIYRPFFLPGLFKVAGSASPITVPAKGKWMFHDFRRFAKRYGVPFWMNDQFPLNSLYMMRGLIAWQDKPELKALGDGFFKAMWADNENVNDPEIMARIVSAAGVDPDAWKAALEDEGVKQQVFSINEDLAKRGAFGAPTFFVTLNGKE